MTSKIGLERAQPGSSCRRDLDGVRALHTGARRSVAVNMRPFCNPV